MVRNGKRGGVGGVLGESERERKRNNRKEEIKKSTLGGAVPTMPMLFYDMETKSSQNIVPIRRKHVVEGDVEEK